MNVAAEEIFSIVFFISITCYRNLSINSSPRGVFFNALGRRIPMAYLMMYENIYALLDKTHNLVRCKYVQNSWLTPAKSFIYQTPQGKMQHRGVFNKVLSCTILIFSNAMFPYSAWQEHTDSQSQNKQLYWHQSRSSSMVPLRIVWNSF